MVDVVPYLNLLWVTSPHDPHDHGGDASHAEAEEETTHNELVTAP